MQSVMIVEPSAAGHRLQHVRRLVDGAIQRGIKPTLLTRSSTMCHPAFAELNHTLQVALLPESKLTDRLIGSNNLTMVQLGYYLMYRSYFASLSDSGLPDRVFVPYLEQIDHAIATLGSPFRDIPWAGLMMKCAFHHRSVGVVRPVRRTDWIKRLSFLRLTRGSGLKCLFTLDPTLCEYAVAHSVPVPVVYAKDPHDIRGTGDRSAIRAKLGIADDAMVILVYGDLTVSAPRKGLDRLLAATLEDEFPQNTVILVAGVQGPVARQFLSSDAAGALKSDGRLVECDKFHSAQEEYEVFAASDIVWVGYHNFYWMSGILIQAGAMSLPSIAANCGVIGWMAKTYDLGPIVDVTDPVAVAAAVVSLTSNPELAMYYGTHGHSLASQHTSQNFCSTIYDSLQ